MSETKNPGEKKLSVSKLTLKPRTETGVVRQSFSHGRSKQVVVEKVKRRGVSGAHEVKAEPAPVETARKPAPAAKAAPAAAPAEAPKPSGVVLRTLTEEERVARAHALADSRVREAEERKIAEEEARRRQSREVVDKTERDAAEARKREEDERRKHDEETKRKAGEVAKKRLGDDEVKRPAPGRMTLEAEEDDGPPKSRRPGAARPAAARPAAPRGAPAKERGRLTLVTALRADEVRERSVASFRRRTQRLKGHASDEPKEKLVREVTIPEVITISDLANRMSERAVDVIRLLMKQGQMATINDAIDADTAQLIAEEMGHSVRRVSEADVEEGLFDAADDAAHMAPRAPVVTVMGHVDHGKTSLLDTIRSADVVSGEAGGITQHIGAYQVTAPSGAKITFIDTPGHAAFTAMRARGAKVTDIVVLVVAADDGVMPQTAEAVQHARAARVPLIVALNKMDKADANPDHVKQGLGNLEVIPEEWGGDTPFVPVSAKTGMDVDELLDAISVQAEVMELTAVVDGPASGVVIESSLDKGRGPVATVLVQQGTLKRGDFVVCGIEYGRMRALVDETGKTVQEAGPSIPVQVLGLSGVPEAGDDFVVVADEKLAKQVAAERQQKRRETRMVSKANRLEDIMAQMGQGAGQQTLNILVKADVQGSVEALRESLSSIGNENVKVNVISAGVGGITESDATLAAASKALVIGFNVRADASARKVIDTAGLDVRYFSIIYDVIDQVKQAASGLLGVEIREEIIGVAQVREVFRSSKFGAVAGCMVVEGHVKRSKPIRVLRDNTVVFEGELESLRRFKDLVDEVRNGMECGIAVKQYNDVKPGDQIECFERTEVARTL